MFPLLQKDLREIKEACFCKNINLNLKNIKIIIAKFILTNLRRVSQNEEALIAKGYNT